MGLCKLALTTCHPQVSCAHRKRCSKCQSLETSIPQSEAMSGTSRASNRSCKLHGEALPGQRSGSLPCRPKLHPFCLRIFKEAMSSNLVQQSSWSKQTNAPFPNSLESTKTDSKWIYDVRPQRSPEPGQLGTVVRQPSIIHL